MKDSGRAAGIRLGKLLALTWKDIDLEKGFILVNKALTKRAGVVRMDNAKTE